MEIKPFIFIDFRLEQLVISGYLKAYTKPQIELTSIHVDIEV